jgi:peptidoglycan/LPS O-acetylase OafA/YrhL
MLVESKSRHLANDVTDAGTSPNGADPIARENAGIANPPLRRVPVLDGVRATAILLVLFGHTVHIAYRPLGSLLGEYGTSLFFVLSGYLITAVLLADEARHGRVRLMRFYRRRALRILPALTVFLLLLAALAANNILPKPSSLTWIASTLYFRNLAGSGWDTQHLWTLALEEQFYLAWPIAFVVFRKYRLALIAIAIVSCTICRIIWLNTNFRDIFDLFQRPDLRLDTFLIGGSLALYPWQSFCKVPGGLAVTAVALWIPLSLTFEWTRPFDTPVAALFLTFCIWWVTANPQSRTARWLSAPFMVLIGTLSYSLYLWQELLLGPHIGWWSLPVLGIAACASYWIIEKPFLKLREKTASTSRFQVQFHA